MSSQSQRSFRTIKLDDISYEPSDSGTPSVDSRGLDALLNMNPRFSEYTEGKRATNFTKDFETPTIRGLNGKGRVRDTNQSTATGFTDTTFDGPQSTKMMSLKKHAIPDARKPFVEETVLPQYNSLKVGKYKKQASYLDRSPEEKRRGLEIYLRRMKILFVVLVAAFVAVATLYFSSLK